MPSIAATSTIVAQAWRFMEQAPISSFGDDTEQAQSSAEQYPVALRECLSRADWSFASALAMLPEATLPDTVAADPDLPYFYQTPGNMVRLIEVGSPTTRWRLDRSGLRATEPAPLRIRYIEDITNEAVLPATFQIAVAYRLAMLLGPRWLGTGSKLQGLDRSFELQIARAKKEDARSASAERYDDIADTGDWSTYATM
jgi:hypothetical protein